MKTFRIDLSAPQETSTGKNLCNLLYSNQDLLSLIKVESACPHHGGVHSLCISGTEEDLSAWLLLFGERYLSSKPLVFVLIEQMKVTTKSVIKAKDIKYLSRWPEETTETLPRWFDGAFEQFEVLTFHYPTNTPVPKEGLVDMIFLIKSANEGFLNWIHGGRNNDSKVLEPFFGPLKK